MSALPDLDLEAPTVAGRAGKNQDDVKVISVAWSSRVRGLRAGGATRTKLVSRKMPRIDGDDCHILPGSNVR